MRGPTKIASVIISGLAIRLLLAPFLAHPFDVYAWYMNGESLFNGTRSLWSFLQPYSYSFFLFAFPATAAFRFLSGIIGSYSIPISSLDPRLNPGAPWNIPLVPGPLFDLLVKLPLIASDAVVALLLYRLVSNQMGDERLATSASLMWFLNPLSIWVSSGWGTFDTLPTLFTVLALYLLFDKKFTYSGISLALAIAMKYYAVVLVFPLLLLAWGQGEKRGFFRSLGGTAATSLLLFIPLFGETTSAFVSLASAQAPSGLYYSGLSFWTAITLFFSGFPQTIVSGGIIVLILGVSYFWMWKRRLQTDLGSAAAYFGIPILALLLGFRFVGENYLIWLLPFGSILALKRRRVTLLFWSLSLLALVSALTDSLLPYYMLPMASWIGGYLVSIIQAAAPYRVASQGVVTTAFSLGKIFLSALGVCATAFLVFLGREWGERAPVRLERVTDFSSGTIPRMGRSERSEITDVKLGAQEVSLGICFAGAFPNTLELSGEYTNQ